MITEPHKGLNYKTFISRLCAEREVGVYLEIGVQNGINISNIKCDVVFGIDPDFALTVDPTVGKKVLQLHRVTSDTFFKSHSQDVLRAGGLDFAFLDGMHLFEYLIRDFYNAEACSKSTGIVAIHDCLPFDGEMIERQNNYAARSPGPYAAAWTGDVWKIIPILEKYRPDLSVLLIDCEPTGLVCITGLDPTSTILKDRYLEIVSEYRDLPNDLDAVKALYANREILSADNILQNFNHSLYFQT